MMIPSFFVDAILLYRAVLMQPIMLNNAGNLDILNLLQMLVANAVFTKSYALIVYFALKYIRERSYLTICADEVVYRRRILVGGSGLYNYAYFAEYHIRDIQNAVIRKSGAVELMGRFPTVFLYRNGKTEHHKSTRKRVIIPEYYTHIYELHEKIKLLYFTQNGD
jgi:hypothetical protein